MKSVRSLKGKLIIFCVLLTIIPSLFIGIFSYQSSYKAIYRITDENLLYIVKLHANLMARETLTTNVSLEDEAVIREVMGKLDEQFFDENGYEGYSYILDDTGKMAFHPDEKTIGQSYADTVFGKAMLNDDEGTVEYDWRGERKIAVYTTLPNGWHFAASAYVSDMTKPVKPIQTAIIWTVIATTVIASVIALLFIRVLLRPLQRVIEAMKRVREGDLTHEIIVTNDDEIAEMTRHFNAMTKQLRQVMTHLQSVSQQLSGSSQQLASSAEESAQSAELVTTSIEHISERTEQQLVSEMQTATVVRRMAQSIGEAVEQVNAVAEASVMTKQQAQLGTTTMDVAVHSLVQMNEQVEHSVVAIDELIAHSEAIEAITKTIEAISAQTHLLALNATIEAARAGEHGRSFGVVAQEVRKLSEETAEASQQIQAKLARVMTDTKTVGHLMTANVETVERSKATMMEAKQSFTAIADSVADVVQSLANVNGAMSAVVNETTVVDERMKAMTETSETIATSLEEIVASTEEQSANSEEVSAAAQQLTSMSEQLQQQIEQFRV